MFPGQTFLLSSSAHPSFCFVFSSTDAQTFCRVLRAPLTWLRGPSGEYFSFARHCWSIYAWLAVTSALRAVRCDTRGYNPYREKQYVTQQGTAGLCRNKCVRPHLVQHEVRDTLRAENRRFGPLAACRLTSCECQAFTIPECVVAWKTLE